MTLTDMAKRNRIKRIATSGLMILIVAIFLLQSIGTVAQAAGLMEEASGGTSAYNQYSMDNYQLDFYVDSSWAWLPWKWTQGISNALDTGIYYVTNFLWSINLFFANATGFLVQEAFSLDFISEMTDSIGEVMQTISGVSLSGFSSDGFYVKLLPFIILIVGVYAAYKGLIKRETSKAISAVLNFVLVFVISSAFIAYSPTYIRYVNKFSTDISTAALTLSSKVALAGSDTSSDDGLELIRDNLFAIQVQQPWLLLQFGDTQIENIGEDRVNAILSVSPDANNGEDREEAVSADIENNDNMNLSVNKVTNRLGSVFAILLLNIMISVFVIALTFIMLFSQILFCIYAVFLPISFLISMIPDFEGTTKHAIMKLFNTILTKAGITLVLMVAFLLSSFVYRLTQTKSFFFVAILQVLIFAAIWFNLGGIMGMFSLNAGESHGMSNRMLQKPRRMMNRAMSRFGRTASRTAAFGAGAVGGAIAGAFSSKKRNSNKKGSASRENTVTPDADGQTKQTQGTEGQGTERLSFGARMGQKVGAVMDTPQRMKDKAGAAKDAVKNLPNDVQYSAQKGVEGMSKSASDFSSSVTETRLQRSVARSKQAEARRQTVAQRRAAMEQRRASTEQEKQAKWSKSAFGNVAKPPRERSVNAQERPVSTPKKPETAMHERPSSNPQKPVNPTQAGTPLNERPTTTNQNNDRKTEPRTPVTPVRERPATKQASGAERRVESAVKHDAARTHTAPTRESVQSPKQPNLDYETFKHELGGASNRGKAPNPTGKEMSRETVKETRTVRQEKSASHESTRTKKTNQTERRTERGKGDAK